MSQHPIKPRTISNPPSVSIFIPYVGKNKEGKTESVFLYYDEYEAFLQACPLCGSPHFINCEHFPDEPTGFQIEYENICLCPNCGFEMVHQTGRPCRGELCPDCHSAMIRKTATLKENL